MPWRWALSSASAISTAIAQRLVERQRTFLEPRGQRLAFEMLHHEVVRCRRAADVVDAADVGMVERGDGARLALEACPQVRIVSDVARQDLDRDRAIEARVARLVDLAHAAGADGRRELRTGRDARLLVAASRVDGACGLYNVVSLQLRRFMRARFFVATTAVSLALAGALIAQQSLPPAPGPT